MFRFLRLFVAFIWEIPQTLLAYSMIIYFRLRGELVSTFEYRGIRYWSVKPRMGAISLGANVIISEAYNNLLMFNATVKHEFGHTIQSLMLGPLYLLVVGLPSITRAMNFHPTTVAGCMSYYAVYPENWADQLGGVNADDNVARVSTFKRAGYQ